MTWSSQFRYRAYHAVSLFVSACSSDLCSDGSYPTVSSHTGEWALNSSSHSLDWTIPLINAEDKSGSLEFSVGGDDAGVFFPVKVSFVGQGSIAGVKVASVTRIDGGDVVFSEDATISVENYTVV